MQLNEEIQEKGSHEPLDFRLEIDHGRIHRREGLQVGQCLDYVLGVFQSQLFVSLRLQELKHDGVGLWFDIGRGPVVLGLVVQHCMENEVI